MKISKITKALPLAFLALALCTPMAFAEGVTDGQNPKSSTVFSVTLPEYLKISVNTASFAKTVTYTDNYASASLESINPVFTVITNNPARDLYLEADCNIAGAKPLFSVTEGTGSSAKEFLYLALANEGRATANAVNSAMSVDGSEHPDVIVVSLTPTLDNDNYGPSAITSTWDTANSRIHYVAKNGTNTFSYTTGTSIEPNSFSTHDTMGTYKVTLTMTNGAS